MPRARALVLLCACSLVCACSAEMSGPLSDAASADRTQPLPDSARADARSDAGPAADSGRSDGAPGGDARAADATPVADLAAQDAAGADSTAAPPLCPQRPNATVFARRAPYTPTPAQPTMTFNIAAAAGRSIAAVTLELSVEHGGWHSQKNGAHGIFQLTRSNKWGANLFGFMTLRDKPSKVVRVISNIDLPQGQVDQLQQTKLLTPGTTYALRYRYDVAAKRRRLQLSAGASDVVDVSDDHVPAIVTSKAPGFQLIIATAFGGSNGPEVPTYGWVYRDICLTVTYR